MGVLILFVLGCFSGFVLFSRTSIKNHSNLPFTSNKKVSVIIPARNEESNLPWILDSIMCQTYKPYEVIVVDDSSKDRTKEIALEYRVKTIENTMVPDGWTGKSWAVWNGFKHSSGDILVFLDADVRLKPQALDILLNLREKLGGVISVVPYHHTEKFYERFSLITNILGIFAFTSPFERKSPVKGLYGSCIIADRKDYEKAGGHKKIKSDIMDDLNLGKRFSNCGVKVENFIGYGLVSFRMYPQGIVSEIQGFAKGAVLGAATLRPQTVLLVAVWLVGAVTAGLVTPFIALFSPSHAIPFVIGYIMYTLQIVFLIKYVGYFGKVMPVLHFLSTLFFLVITLYSAYQVKFLGYVSWKGRNVKIGGNRQ